MAEVTIDSTVFWERLQKLYKSWNGARGAGELWKGADAVVVDAGGTNEDVLYSKSAALQTWLLGYEFPDTIFIFCSRSIYVLSSAKKVSMLEPLKTAENATLPLELLTRNKTDMNKGNYETLLGAIKSSHAGGVVATLNKESPLGDLATGWRSTLVGESAVQQVELAPAIADLLSVKDDIELGNTKRAAVLSAMLIQKQLVARLEAVVDEEVAISHDKLADETEEALSTPAKLGVKLAPELIESCYTPIIQSGGKYDLKPSAYSNGDKLHYGTITCSVGARYKSYCSNVGRTYIIDPTKEHERNYKLLLELQQEAIGALKPDAKLSAVSAAVLARIRSKAPQLESHLTKNCGFSMGLEFREGSLALNGKNETRVRKGMVFNVAIGLDQLEAKKASDSRASKYSLFISDTVVVGENAAEVLTDRAQKQWTDVSYYVKDGAEGDDGDEGGSSSRGRGNVEILESRTRGKNVSAKHIETNDMLANHQAELEETMRLEALERIANKDGTNAAQGEKQETPVAYEDPNQFPTTASGGALRTNQTFVDGKREAVLIPINGRLVPFHISTVKNVSKTDEGAWTFLRINFVAPGQTAMSQVVLPPEAAPGAHFIREITLKSRVPANLNNTFRLIKELRKRVQAREKQDQLEADLVTQDALQLIRTGKLHRLREVNIRPSLGGKKAAGVLELHANGLRFLAPRGEKLDLIFSNIKLAFFQPAVKEILVLMHFHLHNPIMMGKKKTKDVQFYVEVMEASYSLDNYRRSGYDPDELEEEQRERALRNRMNQEFKNFVAKIEDQAKTLEFDIPYRELGFYGVPPHNKSTCFIMPAVNALVELTEPPWFVVPLNDIEVAHFERVVYGLKNFDLVLVLKNFQEKPVHVNVVNMEHLDALKTWLDSCNIKFYEGTANLNWNTIMKHINETGVEGFYDDGGWKFLNMQGSSEEEGEDPEDAESDFAPSGSEEEEEEESDESSFDDSEDSDDSGEGSLDSDESEGKDWDEHEKEAVEADKKRGRQEEEDPRAKGKSGKKSKSKKEYSDSE